MSVNKIVYECLEASLSSFEGIDKRIFYEYLKEKFNLDLDRLGDEFNSVHKALEEVYGPNHFKIERMMVRNLNQGARDGTYDRNNEIAAFSILVNVFLQETEKSMQRNKSFAAISNYAKNLELKVKEANDKLKNAERMVAIGETAAMVGHDIRNPLQAIAGELYMQREGIASLPESDTKKDLLESVRSIEENVYYIDKIVSDLQDFAKPLRAEEEQEVNINDVISDVLTMVPIPDNLLVDIDVENNFPSLCINFQMLKRALANLIQNAVQAMPKGGKLTLKAFTVQDRAEITVEDTGGGIPEDVKPNLFKPLFTTKAKGQGLGLAVVKRLVEAQGARVWFESEFGRGAKFILEIPVNSER